jgi:hypothetical protein
MRNLGLVLITLGFLGGALVAVLDPAGVDWKLFFPILAVAVAGVVLVQLSIRREARDVGRIQASFQTLDERLRRIVQHVGELDAAKADLDVYDLPARIDEHLPAEIAAFVEVRTTIAHAWGTQVYGDVMSHFAAAERYLNRVWSCASDGYIDEAHEYLGRSHTQFSEALARFERAKAANAAAPAP